jgi:prepilin-type N-terminal cleavage/methylation domain-containing protein
MPRARGRQSVRRRARRRGFTLVELIVAILVMTIGILGLASTAGVVTRLMSGAERQTIAANVAQARFELMRNRLCTSLSAGTATTRRVREKWVPKLHGPNLALVVDTVVFTNMSGAKPVTRAYRSYIPCR